VTALDPANVTFRVIHFQDVLKPVRPAMKGTSSGTRPPHNAQCTTHRMFMPKKHPQVKIDPKDRETLRVKPKGATLLFTITPDEYCPVGITFSMGGKRKPTVNDQKRLGILNFAQLKIRPDERSLQVTDHFKAIGKDDRYKFSMIIQRVKDGAIGIIDPGIVNES
jgi:hypothetical protein